MKLIKKIIARQMVNRNKRVQYRVSFLEQRHTEPDNPLYNDSSFFYGGDEEGNAFIARMAFRGKKRRPEVWFDFYLKDYGYLGLKDLPGDEGVGFQFGELYWKPLETGRKWEIGYKGPLTGRQGEEFESEVHLVFTGDHPVYDFVASSDRSANADAIAGEKWNRDFFKKLKELSQTHYEQTGKLRGTVKLGDQIIELNMRGLRDHSFGPRSWDQWDRHYWMSGINDDGWSWTVTTIRYHFINRLTAGFVTDPDGHTDAIVQCTGLEEVSAEQLWPEKGVIDIRTRSGHSYQLEFERKGYFPYLMDDVYRMLEGIGYYRFNKARGLGMIEFGFTRDKYEVGI